MINFYIIISMKKKILQTILLFLGFLMHIIIGNELEFTTEYLLEEVTNYLFLFIIYYLISSNAFVKEGFLKNLESQLGNSKEVFEKILLDSN